MNLYELMVSSQKMLTYLKRMKGNKKNLKGRFINILLCSMRMVHPILLLLTLIITNGQEEKFSMIIKSFVTLSTMATVDQKFVATFPPSVRENAKKINQLKLLTLGKDNNTTKRLFKMLKETNFVDKDKKGDKLLSISQLIGNLLVNLICFLLINL